MKKIVLLFTCFASLMASAQTVLKTRLPGQEHPWSPSVLSGVDSLNSAIGQFKKGKNSTTFKAVYRALINPTLSVIKPVLDRRKTVGVPIDTIKGLPDSANMNSLAVTLDTIPIPADTLALACPKIRDVIVEFMLDAGDNYLGVIEDTTGNSLESFSLLQSNKELFYDKLKKAFADLCDTTTAAEIVAKYKAEDPDLYTQFLQKKEDLANTNSLAGTLRIRKGVPMNYVGTTPGAPSRPPEHLVFNQSHPLDQQDLAGGPYVPTESGAHWPLETHTGGTPAGTATIDVTDTVFTIQSIQIQFEDGFIENIKIFGKLARNPNLLRFENIYPIAFSTKRDFRNLIDVALYEKSNYKVNSRMYILLGKAISYDENLANYNKDYSPANQVFTVKALTDTVKDVPLYKEQTSKLLEVQVFSDLKGIDNNTPNGLIQIDLAKKLNFLSTRYAVNSNLLPWWWFSNREKKGGRGYENLWNVGFFNYVKPLFTLDKIESNDKWLVLDKIDSLSPTRDTSQPLTYTSTIRLLQHQIFSVGFELSIFLTDIPNIKSTFDLGVGFRYGRSAVQDTLRFRTAGTVPLDFHAADTNNVLQYGVNTFQWGPYLTWQIFPDSRFGISITQRFTWFKAPNYSFVQVRDSANFVKFIQEGPSGSVRTRPYPYYDYASNNWFIKDIAKPLSLFTKNVASTEIFAYFSPNADGSNKLFFRYRFNWDIANGKENFYQLQVGFSTYLSATKEYSKLKKAANIGD